MPHEDANYILDFCDDILAQTSLREHRFSFLVGDAGTKLPVDAYYLALNLVIEYHERQHTEAVNFFDKPDKLTVSGVSRGEQRKLYDQRRRDVLPKHEITLVELYVSDFPHDGRKRLKRSSEVIRSILQKRLEPFIKVAQL